MEQERPAEGQERLVAASVVRSNVNRAARELDVPDRYDVVLDVFASAGNPTRVQLVDVTLGPMLPMMGSTVTVRAPAGREPSADDVEILWRGDPNLDVDAHRRQLAELAETARRRRQRPGDS